MLRRLSIRRHFAIPFILTCLLLLSSAYQVLAAPDEKVIKAGKSDRETILQLNQQNQQLNVTRYLALGDSLAYGFQPNDDHTHGYVDDLSTALQSQGVTSHMNLGCPAETTSTFIAGGKCSYPLKSQLATALAYLQQQPVGQATLVTLDIGANDVLGHVNFNAQNKTCALEDNTFNDDLQNLDQNLTQHILPQLYAALTDSDGQSTGNLVLLNYYDPFQNICPKTLSLMNILNEHLAHDIQGLGTLVDIFSVFGGSTIPNTNLCNYTWMCSAPPLGPDIHPTTKGYQIIASEIEKQNLLQENQDEVNTQDLFHMIESVTDQRISKILTKVLGCKPKKRCEGSDDNR